MLEWDLNRTCPLLSLDPRVLDVMGKAAPWELSFWGWRRKFVFSMLGLCDYSSLNSGIISRIGSLSTLWRGCLPGRLQIEAV